MKMERKGKKIRNPGPALSEGMPPAQDPLCGEGRDGCQENDPIVPQAGFLLFDHNPGAGSE